MPGQVNIGRRFMWWPPWNVTRPWGVRAFRGGDEWCNDSAALKLPLLGCFIVFYRRPLRTMPCGECWECMDEWQRGDYLPGGYLEGGKVHQDCADAAFADDGKYGMN